MSARRWAGPFAGALSTLVFMTSCGVAVESRPQPLASAAAPTVAPPEGPVTRLTTIYLVRGERLDAVKRAVPDPVTLKRTVQALLSGPTVEDAGRGLRSALPSALLADRVFVRSGVVVLDLSAGLMTIDSQEQSLALAQLVYTVTTTADVTQVRVLVDGQPVEVPRADGSLTDRDVTRADYAALTTS